MVKIEEVWKNNQCIVYEKTEDVPNDMIVNVLMIHDMPDRPARMGHYVCGSYSALEEMKTVLLSDDISAFITQMQMIDIRELSSIYANKPYRSSSWKLVYYLNDGTAAPQVFERAS